MSHQTIEALQLELKRVKAELRVRTDWPSFHGIPEQFRKAGARSAYSSGHEQGWLGRAYRNPYTAEYCRTAYLAGYNAARQEVDAKIERQVGGRSRV